MNWEIITYKLAEELFQKETVDYRALKEKVKVNGYSSIKEFKKAWIKDKINEIQSSTKQLEKGTKVKILFRPLKELCDKYRWYKMIEELRELKDKKHDLILVIDGGYDSKYVSEEGAYYTFEGIDWCIPTSCFKVIK
jgi:hypothetical protein